MFQRQRIMNSINGWENRLETGRSNVYYSEHEINFRISMIKAFLDLEGEYLRRTENFVNLAPSEKVSVNYFTGNVLSNLLMMKKFDVRWLLHLDLFEGEVNLIKGKKIPDFIGKKLNSSWNAVESKGVQQRRGDTISNAKEQLNNLDSIDGVRPDYRLISILYGNNKTDLTIDIIDPKKEGKLDILTKGINYGRDY